MRPLFLFCRASGASIKYLYDKTFEMNHFLNDFHPLIVNPTIAYVSRL